MSSWSASAPLLAGLVSTAVFTVGHIPMLVRAWRSKDLRSYSVANLLLVNLGNAVHWLYVVSLPVGPVWVLHGFYTVTAAIMLLFYLRYQGRWSAPSPEPVSIATSGRAEQTPGVRPMVRLHQPAQSGPGQQSHHQRP